MLARLCLALSSRFHIVVLLYAPEGLALATGLVLGVRLWLGVFLGEAAWTLATARPLPVALAMGAGNALGMVLGV